MNQDCQHSGVFITFEGGEGAGKTTHLTFLARALRDTGREVVCLREPGGTAIGDQLRRVVLDTRNDAMAPEAELFIYEAARAQLVREHIEPALARGAVVLCDRYMDSTIAYQAYGRGLDRHFVHDANIFASCGILPDRTLFLSCGSSPITGLKRATDDRAADRMEQAGLDFHQRVACAFDDLARAYPDRIRRVQSGTYKHDTARSVCKAVADLVGWDPDHLPFDTTYFAQADSLHVNKADMSGDNEVGQR